MPKILILGNGYVGGELAKHFDQNNVDYKILKRSEFDYANPKLLHKFLLNAEITHVVNCSGFTGRPNIDQAEELKKECWDLNVVIPISISKVCENLDVDYIHISSGCIYTGYEKEWEETDTPNFGLYDYSSFYSKSKHAFETINNYGMTIRVRMPFGKELDNPRSYISKILKYDNLIDFKNSKTYIPDLCEFITHSLSCGRPLWNVGPLNFVNPEPLTTSDFVDTLRKFGVENKNWKFVPIEEINIVAPRSNCVLSTNKLKTMFPNFNIKTESEALLSVI